MTQDTGMAMTLIGYRGFTGGRHHTGRLFAACAGQ
jgi:hypothetical protein